jgi:asparagine synthase (glutamine-hydrolysing)
MANSLELRSPFLDYRLVEFAASLPINLKLRGTTKKYLLKKMLAGRLPAKMIDRKKRGFNAPIAFWLNGELQDVILRQFQEVSSNIIAPEYVLTLLKQHQQKQQDNSFKLYALLCLQMWLNRQFGSNADLLTSSAVANE